MVTEGDRNAHSPAPEGAGGKGSRRSLRANLLRELGTLRPGTTMCAGELAHRLSLTLNELRPLLVRLEKAAVIVISQRREKRLLREVRGPFRVSSVQQDSLRQSPGRRARL